MDHEFYDPTIKTAGDDLRGPIENPGHLVETGREGTTIPLDRTIIIIGSDEASDIRIEHDKVAPYHAEIVFTSGSYRLRHLEGNTPVMLNGTRIDTVELHDGDSIAIADRAFMFTAPAS